MDSEEKQPGGNPPEGEPSPQDDLASSEPEASPQDSGAASDAEASPQDDVAASDAAVTSVQASVPAPPATTEPPPPVTDEEDGDEGGMLRMSFLEHLEELRTRLVMSLMGLGVSFGLCLVFANQIWKFVSAPGIEALKSTGASPNLVFIKPTEAFAIIWVKAPMLASLFLAAPWLLYQVWAFIAPGLYKKERRWAGPFVVCTAGLFILGGAFAYFIAFRFGLAFLLSIGRDINVLPMISATEYFDLFVNATLGIGLVFELPVLLFFLTLLRIVSPAFLIRNTRYAILLIVIVAAVVTPTPDIFNLMLFSLPMCALFFVGVFASYLLVLHREKRRFPWLRVFYVLLVLLAVVGGALYLAGTRYGYHFVWHWPFLTR
jgi:sec-independent protein translocase protein TatC